jgi:acyl carrier protein
MPAHAGHVSNRQSIGSPGGFTVASVQERVIDIVASQLGVSKEQITPQTSFITDLGADSLDTVELVMELEEEFEINIPDDAAEKIQTVGQAVEFIEKHQA